MSLSQLQGEPGNGFPGRLKAAMRVRGFSHRGLAKAIGASQQSVTNWTQGHNEPSLRHLRSIARELGIPLGELLEGGSERPEETHANALLRELSDHPIRPAVEALSDSAPDLLDLLSRAESYVKHLEGPREKPGGSG